MAFRIASRPLGRRFLFSAPLLLGAASACAQGSDIVFQRSSLVIVTAGKDWKFDVEMATNDAERERGLMYRKELGPYEGMLFDFQREMPVSFWMKNTLIPLDMVFIAADGTVRTAVAVTASLAVWWVLGQVVAGRVTQRAVAGWREWFREFLVLGSGLWVGAVGSVLLAALVLGAL